LPDDIMTKIHAAYAKAMADTDTINRLEKLGAVAPAPDQQSRAYLKILIASDVDRWTKVITDAQISIAD
jgi:tripartite-type tricarboxylate transporter receptor subunit TctC